MKNSFCADTRRHNLARLGELMAAVCLAANLAACGGGGGGSDGSDTTPAPSPPAPAPASSTAGDLSSTIQSTTYTSGSREAVAYSALNAVRLASGFGTLAQNVSLDEEAGNQAAYVAENYSMPSGFGGLDWNSAALVALQPDGSETGHVQLSTLPGYVAYLPTERAVHFGYPAAGVVAEAASFFTTATTADNGTACVTGLLGSPGHREVILDPRVRDVGFGFSTLSQPFDSTNATLFGQSCYIAPGAQSNTYSSTGEATAPNGWVAVYPANGSTVPSTDDSHGHGYAPSVTVDSHLALTVSSFTIVDGNGNAVPTTLNADALATGYANWAFATPNAALSLNTTYSVSFQGSAGGAVISKTWTFATQAQ